QVGQVAGITKQQELEPDFYTFIKEHLSKNELVRFTGLHHINTDAGRGRAWLRSTLNEHTLERSIHNILGDKQLLRSYYEPDAFLLDEEKSSMLPMIAAGLSSILFALGIDKEDLNAVKQVSPQLPSTKEVFSNLLSSFPASKPKKDPAAILAETTSSKETKKKKKKKKSAAIVSIDDMDSSKEDIYVDSREGSQDFPISDSSDFHPRHSSKPGHSRSSSYPGKIKLEESDDSGTNVSTSRGFSREISVSDDSILKWTDNSGELYEQVVCPGFSKSSSCGQSVDTIDENDERHIESMTDDIVLEEKNEQRNSGSGLVDLDSGSNFESKDKSWTEILNNEQSPELSPSTNSDTGKGKTFFSIRSFKSRKSKRNSDSNEETPGIDISETKEEDLLSSSVTRESDGLLVMGGDDGLLPVTGNRNQERQGYLDGEEDKNSSKDSMSLSSNSWIDDADEKQEQSVDDLLKARSDSMSAATDAAAAALELCQMGPTRSVTSSQGKSKDNDNLKSPEDTMSTIFYYLNSFFLFLGELKQAIVSMMLRKDEIEDQNRVLRQLLEEKQSEKEVLQANVELLTEDSHRKEDQSVAQIAALTRENEVLKHQLKKYVGAVQMLRNSMNDTSSDNAQALSGIRQDEILPTLPEQEHDENIDSAFEAEEYKQKLIQVAEMHGELMEFNERLQIQYNYWQIQALRLQDELITLRGPLPEDSHARETTNAFDPLSVTIRNRPLINVWIPSVFLKGKGSAGVHHLYQVKNGVHSHKRMMNGMFIDGTHNFMSFTKRLFYKKHKIVETFKFPSKKTFGNRGSKFVEERRKALQEYIRHVVNLLISTEPDLTSNMCKATLLGVMPFFG
ncbi:hypothetical protein QZH41_013986, partial [Actinostola sp. cb2023]